MFSGRRITITREGCYYLFVALFISGGAVGGVMGAGGKLMQGKDPKRTLPSPEPAQALESGISQASSSLPK